MQYKPHKNYRHTLIVGGTLLAIALCFLLFANMGWGYLWLNQLGAVLFISLLILLALRYILYEYIYLLPESGKLLEVRRISGNLPKTLVSITIRPDDMILPFSKEVKKSEGLTRIENCCTSLFPAESYLYICIAEGKKVGVRLECKADFVEMLENAIAHSSNPFQDEEP